MPEKHLHIVSFDIPFPADYGGVIDVYYKVKALAALGVKVHLHCFEYGRAHAPELEALCAEVHYYERHTGKHQLLNSLPYVVVSRRSEELVDRLCQDEHPILFEGLHTCHHLGDPRLNGRARIVRTHNVEHAYYAALARAERAGRRLMINFSYRFSAASRQLKAQVDAGVFGDFYFGRSVWHRRRGMPGFGGWFGNRAMSGGGPLIDLGVHRLDLALWLMGHPEPTWVMGSTYDPLAREAAAREGKAFDVEDLASAYIRFANGASLVLEASWAAHIAEAELMETRLLGTRAGLLQRNLDETYRFEARIFSDQHGAPVDSLLRPPTGTAPSAMHDFAAAILAGTPHPASGDEGLVVMRLLDAVYAWSSGHPYMTQRICDRLVHDEARGGEGAEARVDRLVREVFLGRGRVEDANLMYAERYLAKRNSSAPVTAMLFLYRQILEGKAPRSDPNSNVEAHLRLSGMAAARAQGEGEPRRLALRNRIFGEVFGLPWVSERERELVWATAREWLDARAPHI